jgi:osmotically-inducible protein OsmY
MKNVLLVAMALVFSSGVCLAEVETFYAYVDSDVCARLMLGPITESRIQCSVNTLKDGSNPVVVRLSDNTVIDVNKQKMVKGLVGKLVRVTGDLNKSMDRIKLKEVQEVTLEDIPEEEHGRELAEISSLDDPDPETWEKVRKSLAMLDYLSDFDFISFKMYGETVILTGWTIRDLNRSDAQYNVERIEGVSKVVNNIEVLPLGSFDNDIRLKIRANYQRFLSQYFWGAGSDIKIVVKHGDVILLGQVTREGDRDIATIQAKNVFGVYHVYNLLRVQPSE